MPRQQRILGVLLAMSIAVVFGATLARVVAGPEPGDSAQSWGRLALAGMLLVALPYVFALRRPQGRWRRLDRTNAALLPLLAAPAFLLTTDTALSLSRGGLVVASVMWCAVLTGIAALRWPNSGSASRLAGRRRSVAAASTLRGVALAAFVVGGYLAYLAVVRHWSMQTNTYDLGLFANAIWNSGAGRFFECTLVDSGSILDEHTSPILVVLGLAMRVGLSVEGLLVGSALWLSSGAVAVYQLSARRLGTTAGAVLAFAYLLQPSLHANALWDFHPLSLAAPTLLWLAYLAPRGRGWAFWAVAALLLSLREEMALLAVCLGLYLVLSGSRARGRNLAVVGVAYAFVLLALQGGEVSTHVARYATIAQRGGGGIRGVLTTLALDPAFVLAHVVQYPKVTFVLLQFLPVAFVAFLNPRAWVLYAFGIAFVGLSSSAAVYSPFFHYSSVLYPCVFIAAPDAITRATAVGARLLRGASRRQVRSALIVAIAVASSMVSLTYGGLYNNASFRAGFVRPRRSVTAGASERLGWLREVVAGLPEDYALAVSGRIGPHVAQRRKVYAYPTSEDVDGMILFLAELRPEHKRELTAGLRSGAWQITNETGSLAVYRRVR